jgi:uncharacterized membrane protein
VRVPFALLALATAVGCIAATSAVWADDVPGRAVLAKPDGDALVIWDASPVVASIVKSKTNDAGANDLLERDAVRVLATMAPDVDKSAKTITVRVIYSKTGAVSPVYGTPTFMGIERYATLTVPAADAQTDRDKWKELDPKSAVPAWFAFKVTGLLPPR